MALFDELLKEYSAGQQLEKAGSVMAPSREAERTQRQAEGPLLNAIMNQVRSTFDPFSVGKPGEAMISPSTWKNLYTPKAKAMTTVLANRFPSFFEKILSDPKELLVSPAENVIEALKQLKSGGSGTLGAGMRSLAEYEGMPSGKAGIIRLGSFPAEKSEKYVPILGHEMQHYLSDAPGKMAVHPDTAHTLAQRISEVLPEQGQGSLQARLKQADSLKKGIVPNELQPMVDDIGHATTTKLIQKVAFDEGLAHLTEHTMRQGTPQNLTSMAQQFGVGAGQRAPEAPESTGLLQRLLGFGGQ